MHRPIKIQKLLLATSSILVAKNLVDAPSAFAQTTDNNAASTPLSQHRGDEEFPLPAQPRAVQPESIDPLAPLTTVQSASLNSQVVMSQNGPEHKKANQNGVRSSSPSGVIAPSRSTQIETQTDVLTALAPPSSQPSSAASLQTVGVGTSAPHTSAPHTNSPQFVAQIAPPGMIDPLPYSRLLSQSASQRIQNPAMAENLAPEAAIDNENSENAATESDALTQTSAEENTQADPSSATPSPQIIPEVNPEYINPPRILPETPDYVTPSQVEPEQPDYVPPPQSLPDTEADQYIRPPHVVSDEALHPFTTAFPLNGTLVTHLTDWEISTGYTFGDDRSDDINLNATYRVNGQTEQSLSRDNVFTSDQRGTYVQFQTVRTGREVEVSRRDPQTMLGLIIQESFTGPCLGNVPEATDPQAQCTFTPALVTDRNSINELFFPTRIDQPGNLGDPISPETLSMISEPGFQGVGANGEVLGVDLYFPNIGMIPGNSQGDRSTISRTEDFDTSLLFGFSRVRQILRANDREAAIGRTIRGTGVVWDDDNTLVNTAVMVAAELLPDANPHVEGSENPVSTRINRNLFRAANNAWIPSNSWTIYQAGTGRAAHAQPTETGENTQPNARFSGFWIGLSPVTERESSATVRFEPTGPEQVIAASGGEGGADDNVGFVSNANGNVINSANLRAFYAQVYLTFLRRDVDLVVSNRFTEETTYYPHVSFTGNVTNTEQVFRYYAGVIAAEPIKAYLGGDFTRTANHWTFNASGIGYINPDRDYFSHVQGSVARLIPLGGRSNLSLFSGLRYAFDAVSNPLDEPIDNYVSVGARANLGVVSIGLTQYFDGILPDSIETALGVDAALRLGSRGTLRGYYSPSNNQVTYGAAAEYRFGPDYNSPTLSIGWRRDEYDFGVDASDYPLQTEGDTFTVMLRLGAPGEPFRPRQRS